MGTFVYLSNILGPSRCATLDRGWDGACCKMTVRTYYIHCKSRTEYSVARAIEPTQRTSVPLVSSWLWLQLADVRSGVSVDNVHDLE